MTPRRQGAALILALILLAALLLMGLPFLFSQSTSVAGTRSYASSKLAQIGRDNVENVATALAAYAMEQSHMAYVPGSTPGPMQWSSLTATFANANPATPASFKAAVQPMPTSSSLGAIDDTAGAIGVLPIPLGIGAVPVTGNQGTFLGAVVHDEAGKLDPNDMGVQLWHRLLDAAFVVDWPDTSVYPMPAGPGPFPPGTYFPDGNFTLAKALAHLRVGLATRRISELEQLLQANPQQPGNFIKLRAPLTRSELERLRPYLTVHNPHPGRMGLCDLGTVVQTDAIHATQWLDLTPDPRQPIFGSTWKSLGDSGGPLLGDGSVLIGETALSLGVHATGMVAVSAAGPGVSEENGGTQAMVARKPYFGDALAGVGEAVMLEVPAPVNVHQLSLAVSLALGNPSPPVPPTPPADAPGTTYPVIPINPLRPVDDTSTPSDESIVSTIGTTVGALSGLAAVHARQNANAPFTLFDQLPWTYPLYNGIEQPQLTIMSAGTFSIEASATVTDVLGRQVAQELRKDVVQALPQEYLQERRWLTQGDLHGLVAGRWASHMQAWPVPYERQLSDFSNNPVFPADSDFGANPGSSVLSGTSLRPRIMPDLASIPLTPGIAYPEDLCLRHLGMDWRLTFGANPLDLLNQGDQLFTAADLFPQPLMPTPQQSLDVATLIALPASDLRPDGFHHAAATRMSYPLAGVIGQSTAFVIARADAVVPGTALHLPEMDSRQFGLWLQPQADWSVGAASIMPLCEIRMPPCNVSAQYLDGVVTPGSNQSQNYLGLFYDCSKQMLLLALAPPTIEHTQDDTLKVPSDDPTSQLVDESSLGSDAAMATIASLAPAQYADGGSGLQAFTGLAAWNRILHCFFTPPDKDGTPYFRKGQWYHVQVSIASDRPDGVSLLVDGIAGQDVYKTEPSAPKLSAFGDHCTVPSLSLAAAIPYQQIAAAPTSAGQVGGLLPGDIQVCVPSSPAGLSVQSVLPKRGMVRIDDEYFFYDHISGAGPSAALQGCVRARRQDSVSNSIDPTQVFPNTQDHQAGTTVMPCGYRLPNAPLGGQLIPTQLYRGGALLGQSLADGDANSATATAASDLPAPAWVVWAPIDANRAPDTGPSALPNKTLLLGTSAEIPINTALGVFNQFPPRGIVFFEGRFIFYGAKSGNALTNLAAFDQGWTPLGAPMTAFLPPAGSPAIPSGGIAFTTNIPQPVVVVSIYVSGLDPTTPGAYSITPAGMNIHNPDSDTMISIQDAISGRVEWVRYLDIVSDQGPGAPGVGGFFIDGFAGGDYGFDANHRGRGRTAYAARDTTINGFTPLTAFALQSKVLPVQTELGSAGHWLATGDVVTLMPHLLGPGTAASATSAPPATPGGQLAQQLVIRYAATDGFPSAPPSGGTAGPGIYTDIKNEYFSFSDVIPAAFTPGGIAAQTPGVAIASIDVLCGTCWSGDDLTPTLSNTPQPRGHLPRLDLWAPILAGGGAVGAPAPARVFFGSVDLDYYGAPAAATGGVTATGTDCAVDGIYAGYPAPKSNPLPAGGGALALTDGHDTQDIYNTAAPGIVRCFQVAGATATVMSELDPGAASLAGVVVQASTPMFPWSLGNMGLVAIDGEVFAYQNPNADDEAAVLSTLNTLKGQPGSSGISVPGSISGNPYYARLVARGLLGSSVGGGKHTFFVAGDGPAIPMLAVVNGTLVIQYTTHLPLVPAVRLPVGPVLQLQDTITPTVGAAAGSWFALRDRTPSAGQTPSPATLYAPSAMISAADGSAVEILQLVGPKFHRGYGQVDPDAGKYATASWVRGLYNTSTSVAWAGADPRPVVIGWWPRYASALPNDAVTLTKEYLRSRTYAWAGFPIASYGSYFDAARVSLLPAPFSSMPLAQIGVDDFNGRFTIEARAEAANDTWSGAAPSMDWAQQQPAPLTPAVDNAGAIFSAANDLCGCFHDPQSRPQAVDGAEVRVSWRYANPPGNPNPLVDLAQAGNSAPQITAARVRFLSPVRIIATEHSR